MAGSVSAALDQNPFGLVSALMGAVAAALVALRALVEVFSGRFRRTRRLKRPITAALLQGEPVDWDAVRALAIRPPRRALAAFTAVLLVVFVLQFPFIRTGDPSSLWLRLATVPLLLYGIVWMGSMALNLDANRGQLSAFSKTCRVSTLELMGNPADLVAEWQDFVLAGPFRLRYLWYDADTGQMVLMCQRDRPWTVSAWAQYVVVSASMASGAASEFVVLVDSVPPTRTDFGRNGKALERVLSHFSVPYQPTA
jgi:hypothetical protein